MHRITRSLIAGGALAATLVVSARGTAAVAQAEPTATSSETEDLTEGQTVTVEYSGFPAASTIAVVQCTAAPPEGDDECDAERFELGTADDNGAGSVDFTVHTGTIGADGSVCDPAANNECAIVVTDYPVTVSAVVPITFASTGGSEDETTTTFDDSSDGPDDASDETTDDAVDDADDEDDDGSSAGLLVGAGAVAVIAVIAAVVLGRRRRS